MLYIDFDGVILDTEELLFKKWRQNPDRHSLPEIEKIKYIQAQDWEYILNNSSIVNDSVYYLKQMDPNESAILTKVHSLENEGAAKVKWIRDQGIKQDIILVPHMLKKTDMVDATGNTLIDDSIRNLSEWEANQGYPLFFDIDNDGLDSWHQPNDKGYRRVLSLSPNDINHKN